MKSSRDIIIEDNEAKYYFRFLDWDSCFFHRSSYILEMSKSNLIVSDPVKVEINEKLQDSFVTVKLDTKTDAKILKFLQECGFYYIDTEVLLQGFAKDQLFKEHGIVKVIKKNINRALPYEELGRTFSLTRFHTDINIENTTADDLWISYLKNYSVSDSKHMFTAEVDDEVAGVILVNTSNNTATLFFVAVISRFKGSGIGTVLINKVMDYFNGYEIRTETQIKNIVALNYYIKNGLDRVQSTYTVLHRW